MPSKSYSGDREKLLIGLECCRTSDADVCRKCPYFSEGCDTAAMSDALAYINYLEERLNAKAVGSD